jgi:hypothetical protein
LGLKLLKSFVKNHQKIAKNVFFYQHIVYGNNFAGILKFIELQKEFGPENVRLITEQGIDKQDLINEWKCSLNPLRDEAIANLLTGIKPTLEIIPSKAPVRFYKDSKFHEFGGRTKHFELKPGEELFLKERFNFKWEGLVDNETWNFLDENLREHQSSKIIQQLEMVQKHDLLEKTNFILHTGDFERFECEHLYWNEGPKKLSSLLSENSPIKLSDMTQEYLHGLTEQSAVNIHFDIEGCAYDDYATLYLPQSVTHEWGHFIGDVYPHNPETNKQEMVFTIMLTDEDKSSEEELAKKIKLLKRVMERTIPNFSKCRYSEHIRYQSEMYFEGMNDELTSTMKEDHPQLHFIGAWAPLANNEIAEARNFVRSFLAL